MTPGFGGKTKMKKMAMRRVRWLAPVLFLVAFCSCNNRVHERIRAMSEDELREYVATHPSGRATAKAKQELGRRAYERRQAEARANPAPPPQNTLNVDVGWGYDTIQIKNVDSASAVGSTMTIYLNDTPPFTFKATWNVPAVGETASIPLNVFVKKDGTRFDPRTRAVTEAWVGGGGYDFQKYH